MDITTQKRNAKNFIEEWKDRGREKQDSQSFWLSLLRDVLGIEKPETFIRFEEKVKLSNDGFIDGYIDQTHVMIEQKSSNKDLDKAIRQSGGELLTPFQQAKKYSAGLPYSRRPRWIVTCNFKEFRVYDMEHPNSDPVKIELKDLATNYYQLEFLVDKSNENIDEEKRVSLDAGELVGKIYDELLKQYKDPSNEYSQKSINQLCVRIVFCLYAEDAGIFGKKNMFHDYLEEFDTRDIRKALITLFKVLDTKVEDRDQYLADDNPKLDKFPYVNGGMFSDEDIEIPPFTDELRDLLLRKASGDFDWSKISPTIFGAVFESTLNPETRRQGGMHYTSVENIHKVIDPLFLNDLKDEINEIKKIKQPATLKKRAKAFQEKLANLTFFDPACGSGNFLTETYLQLRKLENDAIKLQYTQFSTRARNTTISKFYSGNMQNDLLDPTATLNSVIDTNISKDVIKVSIKQFYGIEINDFAVSVAKTALWIAESQMWEETKDIFYADWDFLPLKTYINIHEGNALLMDWNKIIPNYACHYIMGNPPFIGYTQQNKMQKKDLKALFCKAKNIDYVTGWYIKASQYIQKNNIQVAFVSTNSITEGEQVSAIWVNLKEKYNIEINFAYRTFVWDSEASEKAHVHVVIIGFSYRKYAWKTKKLYIDNHYRLEKHINFYLLPMEDIFVKKHQKPLNGNLIAKRGSQPTDGGNLILSEKEKNSLIKKYPLISIYVRRYMMGNDLINNKKRYCLWFKNANPSDLRKYPEILKRINAVREFRIQSKKKATQKKASVPYLFDEIKDCQNQYIAIPVVSSQTRRYIPMAYLGPEVISGNKIFELESATVYDFGVLESNMHMAWMRAIGGRLKSDYSYSNTLVLNNFPWPRPTKKQRDKISQTAENILKIRKKFSDSSLADLYDPLTMPKELLKAHQDNDRAVMEAYGLPIKGTTESDAVAHLFKMYRKLTNANNEGDTYMKLSHELERDMMLSIEKSDKYDPSRDVLEDLRSKGYEDRNIIYTAQKLYEGHLIEKEPSVDPQGFCSNFATGNLTYEGHQILDNIRDDSVWAKAKEMAKKAASSASLSIIADVAGSYIKAKVGL